MSILIGYGKTKTDKNGKTYISGFFTEEFLKICPQFKGMLINQKYIDPEARKTQNSPHWAIELFIPQNGSANGSEPQIPQEQSMQNSDSSIIPQEEISF